MNIFVLDSTPEAAARMLCDTHVVSQLKEACQMLATVSRKHGGHVPLKKDGTPYETAHPHHPCTLWSGTTLRNWTWLVEHAEAAADEYMRRFGNDNDCVRVLGELAQFGGRPDCGPLTAFAQAMPEQYRGPDAVEAYRRYYAAEKVWQKRRDGKRIRLARWERGTPAPAWWPHREAA